MTFDMIEQTWGDFRMDILRRLFWKDDLTGPARGWFHACLHAVQTGDTPTLQAWLNPQDKAKQAIMRFYSTQVVPLVYQNLGEKRADVRARGKEAAAVLHAHLSCALVAMQQHGQAPLVAATMSPIAQAPALVPGLLRDLTTEFLSGHVHPAACQQQLTTILVRKGCQSPGVVATLTLEAIPDGTGAFYAIPALAFLPRDREFRQQEEQACMYVQQEGLWPAGWDVRWQLTRADTQPIEALSGPSMGASFAVGLAKVLCGREG